MEQEYRDFEIIVVDDASEDNSEPTIKSEFNDVEVVTLDKNRGPAVARNVGIHRASGNIIVGFDSDVVLPDRYTLKRIFLKFTAIPELDCLALRVLNFYTRKDDIKTWCHPFSIDRYANSEFITDYFSGSAYAFRRRVFEKAGYYPEDLFMHNEERDLAFRILDSGFDIVYCPTIAVLHKVSERPRNDLIPLYYHRRNQIWITVKYYPFFRGVAFLVPRLLKTFLLTLFKGGLISYVRAIRDGICGIPDAKKLRHPLRSATWHRIRCIRKGQYS
jgi:GT2 family glycosyltransferase